jgi:enterochelin esterase-like enzyme
MMRRFVRRLVAVFVPLVVLPAAPQMKLPVPAFHSHEVHADGSITFRIFAPTAKVVKVSCDCTASPLTMTRDDFGLWSVTTPPLPPEIYGYAFDLDGVSILDPINGKTRPNIVYLGSEVEVKAPAPMPWDLQAIPHGSVTYHAYTTHIAKNLPADQETYLVYTPAGYDAKKVGGYPVLYLLHGWSDYGDGWRTVGRADHILDSLMASGKAVPMIVVMPMGYGNYEFVQQGFGVWHEPAKVAENTKLFEAMLREEIMPAVDQQYNTAHGRDHRAIAGLSMGGLESLTTGLQHPDEFAYVGGFSSAVMSKPLASFNVPMDKAKSDLRLLWIACGVGDDLVVPNREFIAAAKAQGLSPVAIETPGKHEWPVWRANLIQFVPLLFR